MVCSYLYWYCEVLVLSQSKSSKKSSSTEDEPLLKENPGRFVIFPIQHHDIWQMYKKAEASFWTAEEVCISGPVTTTVHYTICRASFW